MAKKIDNENVGIRAEITTGRKERSVEASFPSSFSLPNTKVLVKPIIREGAWLPDGHSGSFLYDNTGMIIMTPVDSNTGKLKNPLTKEEQKFFETESDLDLQEGDLNPFKKHDNFWIDFDVRIRKNESIVDEKTVLMSLDLSDPIQYLQYKVLLANSNPAGGLVAPSWGERENSGTYKIALVHEEKENEDKIKKADKMRKAYAYFEKINSFEQEMFDFLTIYYIENGKGKRPSPNAKKDFYYSEIQTLIDNDLDGFISIVEDSANYEYKLLVHRGLRIGALVMIEGNKIETADGIPVGNSLSQAVQWFKDERHQEDYLRLKNQIELSKN